MAKRSTRKKPSGGLDLSWSLRPEIAGILLLLVALLTLLSLIPVERGVLMQRWIDLLRLGVGWGVWLMPICFVGLGLWLIFRGLGRELGVERERPVGAIFLFVLVLALVHLIASGDDPQALAALGDGGGYLGYAASNLLVSALGTPATVLVLVTLSIISLMMVFGVWLDDVWMALKGAARSWPNRQRLLGNWLLSNRLPMRERLLPRREQLPLEAAQPEPLQATQATQTLTHPQGLSLIHISEPTRH